MWPAADLPISAVRRDLWGLEHTTRLINHVQELGYFEGRYRWYHFDAFGSKGVIHTVAVKLSQGVCKKNGLDGESLETWMFNLSPPHIPQRYTLPPHCPEEFTF